jgi:hypothetical protein
LFPAKEPNESEKGRFQVYGFGKTVWEFYSGRKPVINEDDLLGACEWAKSLVDKCCGTDGFNTTEEVVVYICPHPR